MILPVDQWLLLGGEPEIDVFSSLNNLIQS